MIRRRFEQRRTFVIPFPACFDKALDKLLTLLLDLVFGKEEPFEYTPKTWRDTMDKSSTQFFDSVGDTYSLGEVTPQQAKFLEALHRSDRAAAALRNKKPKVE